MQDLIYALPVELGSGRKGHSEGKEEIVVFIERPL